MNRSVIAYLNEAEEDEPKKKGHFRKHWKKCALGAGVLATPSLVNRLKNQETSSDETA